MPILRTAEGKASWTRGRQTFDYDFTQDRIYAVLRLVEKTPCRGNALSFF